MSEYLMPHVRRFSPRTMSDNTASVMTEVTTLMKNWEEHHADPNYDPINTLTRLAEICEVETDNYLKMDPDPFDERHPSRTDPECKLGQILTVLFRRDSFMNKLVNDYLRDSFYSRANISGRDVDQLNIAACRLMLDVMPGLETSVVFQPDGDSLIQRLIKWSTNSIEPLQSYATGLLAAAMEIQDIATRFKEQNGKLVPLLLQRLHRLQASMGIAPVGNNARPFAHLSSLRSPPFRGDGVITASGTKRPHENGSTPLRSSQSEVSEWPHRRKKAKLDHSAPRSENGPPLFSETSNSSWAEMEVFMIGTGQIFPPTLVTRQILILRYLTPMGEYQDFLSHVFENDALSLILAYVNVKATKEARLGFEALKYLASLLCHKKFSVEFIQMNGLEVVLSVPRPSMTATGVSICLYYLGYCEEAMERVCLLPQYIISRLVEYGLWLLECSHDSGRCHAIMFFGLTFQFKVILEEFDARDGLRKLHNVISTLSILLPDSDIHLNEDQKVAARQIVRHVCVAYRRYLETHLSIKVEPIRRSQMRPTERASQPALPSQPSYKAVKSSPQEIQEQVDLLIQHMPFRVHWGPVDQLLKLDGITLLLKTIAFAYEWNYSGRAETLRSALDVLAIACVIPKVQLKFCDRLDLPDDAAIGMNIILVAAEGDVVADPEVQKAALRVIVNCVCGPIHRVGGSMARFSTSLNSPVKKKLKSSDDLIHKVWDCVRSSSGIMVLLKLMNIKTPITDADCIRTLACKALAGLARSPTVQQIVSKLPLFTSSQLQNLMRDPILQEKRQEHVTFQKHAQELLEILTGKAKHTGQDMDASLVNIHRANVVAQTKIQFNDQQVLQLIHQHLIAKNCNETAALLVKEANLGSSVMTLCAHQPSKFRYSSTLTPARHKLSLSFPNSHQRLIPSTLFPKEECSPSPTIKIIKKNQVVTPAPISKLQKQTNSDLMLRTPTQSFTEEAPEQPPRVTLDSIITEFLTNQHALCKNPMANCPKFNLFIPHKCPDPKPRITSSNNFVVRCARRAIGYQSKDVNRKFIHSRFCPTQTIRASSGSDSECFTCVKFLPGDQSILVGDYSGDVRSFNLRTGAEEFMFQAHDNCIVHIEPNRTGEFLLTSSVWGRPYSALWAIQSRDMKFPLDDEEYVEYSKVSQNRIIGTKQEVATIYDANNGSKLMRLVPEPTSRYSKNKATFSPYDDLILSDGVLFDVKSGKQIHKLDKLNETQSGVFHPNGLEIVSNTEVWDIRTFHLLKTVSILDQCSVTFSSVNNAIYATSIEQQEDDNDYIYDTSFKTVDAIDYSSIATIDVRKNIYDLAVNRFDTQIAIVENQGLSQYVVQESVVRIYDVGRKRDDEDELGEEDDDEEEDDDDDRDGSDDDNSDNDAAINMLDAMIRNEGNDDNGNDTDDDFNFSGSDSESWASITSTSDSYEADLDL